MSDETSRETHGAQEPLRPAGTMMASLQQGYARSVTGEAVTMTQSCAGRVQARKVNVTGGSIGLATGKEVEVEHGRVGAAIAREVELEHSQAGLVIAGRVKGDNVTVAVTASTALAFGAGLGVILALIGWLRRR